MWRDIQEATKDKRKATERTPMPKVFADWRCSKAILDFLAHTEVGRTVPRTPAPTQGDDEEEGEDAGADEASETEDDEEEEESGYGE